MFYQCLENDCIPFQWEEHLKLHFIKIGRGGGGGGGGGSSAVPKDIEKDMICKIVERRKTHG